MEKLNYSEITDFVKSNEKTKSRIYFYKPKSESFTTIPEDIVDTKILKVTEGKNISHIKIETKRNSDLEITEYNEIDKNFIKDRVWIEEDYTQNLSNKKYHILEELSLNEETLYLFYHISSIIEHKYNDSVPVDTKISVIKLLKDPKERYKAAKDWTFDYIKNYKLPNFSNYAEIISNADDAIQAFFDDVSPVTKTHQEDSPEYDSIRLFVDMKDNGIGIKQVLDWYFNLDEIESKQIFENPSLLPSRDILVKEYINYKEKLLQKLSYYGSN